MQRTITSFHSQHSKMVKLFILALLLTCETFSAVLGAQPSVLLGEESLWARRTLDDPKVCFFLSLQDDGNLVLYRYSDHQVLWATNTANLGGRRLTMQGDGNLVLYDYENRPLWTSNTMGNPNTHLELQIDGNMVVYSNVGKILWATGTVTHC